MSLVVPSFLLELEDVHNLYLPLLPQLSTSHLPPAKTPSTCTLGQKRKQDNVSADENPVHLPPTAHLMHPSTRPAKRIRPSASLDQVIHTNILFTKLDHQSTGYQGHTKACATTHAPELTGGSCEQLKKLKLLGYQTLKAQPYACCQPNCYLAHIPLQWC
jgi:hypothetical protein